MKRILYILLATIGLALGAAAGFAAAGSLDKPPAPPGKDPCSHGNTGKPCKPDPQPDKGKDCEKHGKEGGVNEDHCKGETNPPTTTTGTTTTETTTTTDKTTTQETTTSTTTTTPPTTSTSATPPPTTTTPAVVPPVAPPTKGQAKGVTPKELEKELKTQAKKNGASEASPAPEAVPGELPRTGLPLGLVALLGMGLAAGGLAMRRV